MFRAAQFHGLLPVPGVYQPVVAAQDRFEKTVVAVVVLGNEDRQFVLFDRNRRDLPARGFAGLAGDVGKREPEGRAAPFFRLHADLSAEMFDDAFADRKPESRALFEGVEFDEPVENPPLPFGRNAAARVGDVETEPAALRPVAEADRPFGGEFRGVGQQVDQQLRKPVAVGVEQTCVKPRFLRVWD